MAMALCQDWNAERAEARKRELVFSARFATASNCAQKYPAGTRAMLLRKMHERGTRRVVIAALLHNNEGALVPRAPMALSCTRPPHAPCRAPRREGIYDALG